MCIYTQLMWQKLLNGYVYIHTDIMGRMQIVLSDDLEKEFREEVFKRMGMKKGNVSLAVEDAVKQWIVANKEKRSAAAKNAWEKRKKD